MLVFISNLRRILVFISNLQRIIFERVFGIIIVIKIITNFLASIIAEVFTTFITVIFCVKSLLFSLLKVKSTKLRTIPVSDAFFLIISVVSKSFILFKIYYKTNCYI